MISVVVDLGSNTIRLSIYQWESGNFKLLLNKKEMAGLAGLCQGRQPVGRGDSDRLPCLSGVQGAA